MFHSTGSLLNIPQAEQWVVKGQNLHQPLDSFLHGYKGRDTLSNCNINIYPAVVVTALNSPNFTFVQSYNPRHLHYFNPPTLLPENRCMHNYAEYPTLA